MSTDFAAPRGPENMRLAATFFTSSLRLEKLTIVLVQRSAN